MKFLHLNRILHPRSFMVTMGFVLMSANPAQSIDSFIAFSSDRDSPGDQDIFVMMADGSQPRNLTNNPTSYDSVPDWSPDGTKIAFCSDRNGNIAIDGNLEIYVMDADGDNPTNLTQNPVHDVVAAWSPGRLAVSPTTRLLTLWGTTKTAQGKRR